MLGLLRYDPLAGRVGALAEALNSGKEALGLRGSARPILI